MARFIFRNKRYTLILAVIGCTLFCGKPGTTSHDSALSGCGDFLVIAGHRIPNLQFSYCMLTRNAQSRVLRAVYTVTGPEGQIVESYLIKRFGMKPLRFVCCGWESPNGDGMFEDSKGYRYWVRMYSGETVERQRSRLKELFVTVDRFDEQP